MILNQIQYLTNLVKSKLSKRHQKSLTHFLDNIWSGNIKVEDELELIGIYHDQKIKNSALEFVDDNTWCDLNMDEVFYKINRTTSSIGSQYLYHLLHKYDTSQEILDQKYGQYQFLISNENLRKRIQKSLIKLRNMNACYTAKIIFEELPEKPRYYFLFPILSLSFFLSVFTLFFINYFFFIALGIAIINVLLHQYYTPKIAGFIPDMNSLGSFLKAVVSISKFDSNPTFPEIQLLKQHSQLAKMLNKKIGWLIIDTTRLDDFSALIIDYFNHFFLVNLITFLRSLDELQKQQRNLIEMYENIGSLDASTAVASYLNSSRNYCEAKFVDENQIVVTDIIHPLLDNPVANSFSLTGKSCLITGSNMAGKTTFIKTIGVNIILSRSLNVCLAKSAIFPKAFVKSSIKRQDIISENKSYYYKEIEDILNFIHLAHNSQNYIFLIDEIFRGTNTIERLSSATAVLEYLNKKNICLVTTHDIELQELLDGQYEMYHFKEQIKGKSHFFNYHIKPGPCHSGNAIRLLELIGYPNDIVQKAFYLSSEIASKTAK